MALRTKNAIRRSFIELLAERPFDKISVRDIAERSEVTRNTFYYYYTDIYALAEDVFETEIERLSESANSYESWQKAFLAATAFTAENKRMIQHRTITVATSTLNHPDGNACLRAQGGRGA